MPEWSDVTFDFQISAQQIFVSFTPTDFFLASFLLAISTDPALSLLTLDLITAFKLTLNYSGTVTDM